MKYCVIILDGASGWPLDSLGDRTSLQAAATPNLDRLAREGTVGLARTVPAGEEPSSAAACTSILGYDPVADHVGRGAIEAASLGIGLAPDEVALRLNLVSIEDGVMRSYSCGHIPTAESRALVAELQDALGSERYRFYPGVAYRHILVVKGHPELLDLEYTPPHDISDMFVAEHIPRGAGSRLLLDLMEQAHPVLAASAVNAARRERGDLPASDVWMFWPGVAPRGMRPFSEVRGLAAAMTSGVDLLNGLAVLTGIDRLEIVGVTDGSDNDYAAQTGGALKALIDHDLVVVHVESPDEEGHAGDAAGKVAAIEAIDREVLSRVLDFARETPLRVLAMPDHPTPVRIKTHVGEPVPFVIWGPGVADNDAGAFDEASAAATGLHLDPGHGVMDLLLSDLVSGAVPSETSAPPDAPRQ
jgi:2,3-bisphosphoglycerate-independent phosphoglycerate mutase